MLTEPVFRGTALRRTRYDAIRFVVFAFVAPTADDPVRLRRRQILVPGAALIGRDAAIQERETVVVIELRG